MKEFLVARSSVPSHTTSYISQDRPAVSACLSNTRDNHLPFFISANISELHPVYNFSGMCYSYFNLSVLRDDADVSLIPLNRL